VTQDLLCTIFVDGASLTREGLAEVIDCCNRIRRDGIEVEIRDRTPEELVFGRSFPDDFFGFSLSVELYGAIPLPSQGDALIEHVASVLRMVWSCGARAVASCGFEDRLPNLGGLMYTPGVYR
jgi:hypothetical protein